ncbi:hypothetical protein [Jannaschia seohaensis]|uniref:Uncharacterized protein n=1 Tax=Jannaschia seohaensis TaxID=475081 RepID=A0A2Y9B435_9RHOB|nr:hypothetical protein [Jannaschia seohaensis]PWJ11760.1 hypothetical protein BCF38_11827 [Jannaschia seohaensis]SSA51276.1 hypothetical protein SAMN05421539_11827 [Jannaschia seohaensis]
MGLKKLAEKVEDYNARLESGMASKIQPNHVEKVLKKLRARAADLEAEIAATPSVEKQSRLQAKLAIARTHIARAEWLLKELA